MAGARELALLPQAGSSTRARGVPEG
ncbi:hypothetical protein NOCARDAX2BIS_30068 [Nocardioides sp. AX2bis]|nr:hypothetical protein NOCARDAX2BIS_30068 [Nocardioides sp. AX2bis]